MGANIELPSQVRVNAWGGGDLIGDVVGGRKWGLRKRSEGWLSELSLLRPGLPNENDWSNPEIGWGLVLPDRADMDASALATGADLPRPLRRLCSARNDAPILRWRTDLYDGHLRRYYPDGKAADLSVAGSKPGTGRNCIPKYLLIWGGPEIIPWRTQYVLNMTSYVGRLALTGAALEGYVEKLLSGWSGAGADARSPLVWSVDHGKPDMSWVMRGSVADPLWAKLQGDGDLAGRTLLGKERATGAELAQALAEKRPGFIATTSHGATGPTDNAQSLAQRLGWLIDANHDAVSQTTLAQWSPDGAIWYAHACCSAGSDSPSRYDGLFGEGDSVGRMLRAVSEAAGSRIAPLPQALLSHAKPLRAWVGHVEPTFDWTLRDPTNNQVLTYVLVNALYDRLYQKDATIGWALQNVFVEAGKFLALWQEALNEVNDGNAAAGNLAVYRQLVAMDRQNVVILGDPTVSLAPF